MGRKPDIRGTVVLQRAVSDGKMIRFQDKLNDDSFGGLFADGEADGIGRTVIGQARTGVRVPEVAGLEITGGQIGVFVTRHRTRSAPCGSQRQPSRMWQSKVFDALDGQEKRTGQYRLRCGSGRL
jgi:hypothetical protein